MCRERVADGDAVLPSELVLLKGGQPPQTRRGGGQSCCRGQGPRGGHIPEYSSVGVSRSLVSGVFLYLMRGRFVRVPARWAHAAAEDSRRQEERSGPRGPTGGRETVVWSWRHCSPLTARTLLPRSRVCVLHVPAPFERSSPLLVIGLPPHAVSPGSAGLRAASPWQRTLHTQDAGDRCLHGSLCLPAL